MHIGWLVIAFIAALAGCSTVEDPVVVQDTTLELLDSNNTDTSDVCPPRYTIAFEPSWYTFIIEVGDGPAVGIDAIIHTHTCTKNSTTDTALSSIAWRVVERTSAVHLGAQMRSLVTVPITP